MALAAACAATLTLAPAAFADGGGQSQPEGPGREALRQRGLGPEHRRAPDRAAAIATLNDDTREVFSPGYTESLDYVVQTLRDAGYNPKVTPFNFPVWKESKPPVLNMVSPTPKTYRPGTAAD